MTPDELADPLACRLPDLAARAALVRRQGPPDRRRARRVAGRRCPASRAAATTWSSTCRYADGGRPRRYQLLARRRQHQPPAREHAVDRPAPDDGADARLRRAADEADQPAPARRCIAAGRDAPSRCASSPSPTPSRDRGPACARSAPSRRNTSLVYGDASSSSSSAGVDAGLNPDLELHRALRRGRLRRTSRPLLGAIEGSTRRRADDRWRCCRSSLPNAADGWAMAMASVRDLLAEADLHADEVGGDFAGEAHGSARRRRGAPRARRGAAAPRTARRRRGRRGRGRMHERLDRARGAVPSGVAEQRDGACAAAFARRDATRARRRCSASTATTPRPGAAHAHGWVRARLRGRAGAAAGRAARASTRRCATSPGCCARSTTRPGTCSTDQATTTRAAARPPRAGVGRAQPGGVLRRLRRGAADRPAGRRRAAAAPSSWTRRSTRWSTRPGNRPAGLPIPLRSIARLLTPRGAERSDDRGPVPLDPRRPSGPRRPTLLDAGLAPRPPLGARPAPRPPSRRAARDRAVPCARGADAVDVVDRRRRRRPGATPLRRGARRPACSPPACPGRCRATGLATPAHRRDRPARPVERSRRPVPVPADARRARPAPDRRGPARAALGRARRARPPYARPTGRSTGTSFAVWAPNARGVRVAGDFNCWDGRGHPMRSLGSSGVWELFVPGVGAGARYKFRDPRRRTGSWRDKADPMALRHRAAAGDRRRWSPTSTHELERRRVDGRARDHGPRTASR